MGESKSSVQKKTEKADARPPRKLREIIRVDMSEGTVKAHGFDVGTELFMMGEIMITKAHNEFMWVLSIGHPRRKPTVREVDHIRGVLLPGITNYRVNVWSGSKSKPKTQTKSEEIVG